MNKKGAAMLLALVLSVSVLPAAVALVSIARSDLISALEDYHSARVWRAEWGGLELVKRDLLAGGSGNVIWPDPEITLTIEVWEGETDWQVGITASSELAVAKSTVIIAKEKPPSLDGPYQ